MIKRSLIQFLLPIVAVIMLIFTFITISKNRVPPVREITNPPPTSTFRSKIAAVGILEPDTKVIKIVTDLPGILKKVYVKEGDTIHKGSRLFLIDDRETKAELRKAYAQLETAIINHEDLAANLKLFESIKDKRAISVAELNSKKFAVERAQAIVEEAKANVELLKVNLDRLTVRSSIDGSVLKIYARVGELISQNSTPSIAIGNLSKINVRVSVDDADVQRLSPDAAAFGTLRGNANLEIPLTFSNIEPYVIPKLNLSNDVVEKIDTRIIEVIYEFDNSKVKAIPGQQMDVFIEVTK